MLGSLVTVVLIGFALMVLFAIVRFSIISPARTRGADRRLRHPQPDGIEQICSFSPSPGLVDFYRNADVIERTEFYFVDESKQPAAAWFIGGFTPLTPQDVRERVKIVRVDGIPIADDLDKGVYYMTRDGTIRLRSPNTPLGDVEVARTIAEFARFATRSNWPDSQ